MHSGRPNTINDKLTLVFEGHFHTETGSLQYKFENNLDAMILLSYIFIYLLNIYWFGQLQKALFYPGAQ